jgi:hypothetical protein
MSKPAVVGGHGGFFVETVEGMGGNMQQQAHIWRGQIATPNSTVVAIAWVGMLLASYLPGIIWREVFSGNPADVIWLRVGAAVVLAAAGFVSRTVAPLRRFFVVVLVLIAATEILAPMVMGSAFWQATFDPGRVTWSLVALAEQILRLVSMLAPWLALLAFGYRRHEYFVARGELDAAAQPVRWLDIKTGQKWIRVGAQFGIVFTAITVLSFLMAVRPAVDDAGHILALLPAALGFAALNAFGENFAYRAAPLATLMPATGTGQAMVITAVFFGLGHYYSFPPGAGGVLLAALLGWVLAKSMIETRGFVMPWLLQLPLDIIAFLTVLTVAGI